MMVGAHARGGQPRAQSPFRSTLPALPPPRVLELQAELVALEKLVRQRARHPARGGRAREQGSGACAQQ
jgi:hypothetical protein